MFKIKLQAVARGSWTLDGWSTCQPGGRGSLRHEAEGPGRGGRLSFLGRAFNDFARGGAAPTDGVTELADSFGICVGSMLEHELEPRGCVRANDKRIIPHSSNDRARRAK